MKYLCSVLLALSLSFMARAADAVPIFKGVMTLGADSRFVLVGDDGTASQWIKLGDKFAGYSLKTYDAKDTTLELERDGKSTKVILDSGRGPQDAKAGTGTPGTLAAANELMRVMRFDDMMQKLMDQQQKAIGPALKGPMEQAVARLNLSPEEQAAYTEFQQKLFGDLFNNLLGPDFKGDMAKAYSEAFTQEELSAQAAFYSTPAGEALVDKTPEIQAKINALITPRIMAGMGTVQQSMTGFMQDLARKRAAAAAAK